MSDHETANEPPIALENWVVDYDEALVRGSAPPMPPVDSDAIRVQAGKVAHCLAMLESVWPRELPPGATVGILKDQQNTDTDTDIPLEVPEPWPDLGGRFEIIEYLGEGGFGVVFKAFDPRLSREVALKIPKLSTLAANKQNMQFEREAQALARLDHPHVVPVFEAGETGRYCYIASRLCAGPSLDVWIAQQSHFLPCRMVAQLGVSIADGLEHAHQNQILHRDLKPANVLLDGITDQGVPWLRITDFGLARINEAQWDATESGILIGTLSYMAPEQALGHSGLDARTDVYCLGAVLYEMLVGRPPHRGENQLETLRQVQTREPVAPRAMRAEIPRELETICLKCLDRDPTHRYKSAADVRQDLSNYLEGKPISAKPISNLGKAWKMARRFPLAACLVGCVTALLVAIVLGTSVAAVVLKKKNDMIRRAAGRATVAEAEAKRQLWNSLSLRISLEAQSQGIGARAAAERTFAEANMLLPDVDVSAEQVVELRDHRARALEQPDFVELPLHLDVAVNPQMPIASNSSGTVVFAWKREGSHYSLYRHNTLASQSSVRIAECLRPPHQMVANPNGDCVAFTYAATSGMVIEVWRTSESTSRRMYQSDVEECHALDLTSDSKLAFAESSDLGNRVQVVDISASDGEPSQLAMRQADARIESLRFDPSGERLAMAVGNRVDILRLTNSEIESVLQHSYPPIVRSLAWDRAGKRILVGRADFNAYMWQVDCAEEPWYQFVGHTEQVRQVGFAAHDLVLSGGVHGVMLWELVRGDCLLQDKRKNVVIFDGGFFYSSEGKLWKALFSRSPLRRVLHSDDRFYDAYAATSTIDSQWLAAGGLEVVHLWSGDELMEHPWIELPRAHTLAFEPIESEGPPQHLLAVTPDGIYRAALGEQDYGQVECLVSATDILSNAATISAGGKRCVWLDRSSRLNQWSQGQAISMNSEPIFEQIASAGDARKLEILGDPYRQRVAIMDRLNDRCYLVDLTSGRSLLTLDANPDVLGFEFTPDAGVIIRRLRRGWEAVALDFEKGLSTRLAEDDRPITGLRFSADMQHAFLGRADGRIQMKSWPDLQTHMNFDCRVSPDWFELTSNGQRLITPSQDLKVSVWDIEGSVIHFN